MVLFGLSVNKNGFCVNIFSESPSLRCFQKIPKNGCGMSDGDHFEAASDLLVEPFQYIGGADVALVDLHQLIHHPLQY